MKFRKKPVVIEAMQFVGIEGDEVVFDDGSGVDVEIEVPEWIQAAMDAPDDRPGALVCCNGQLIATTLEGPLVASPGDWIIRGVKGEFYPCKPDIFAETYEAAE